ncbi:hypothetical protein FSP39_000844 [Pinctada imbricata]|uniref:Uncharacterized protein n=1 Tax=Pinctada imbricata TaxID=66713 RepID=A0AA89C9J2_PINIB|nr:hypothetical protein FSP39_000844 [Pinctada imbricata]
MAERQTHSATSHHTHSSSETEATRVSATPAHQQWAAYSGPVLFTGPDGLSDYKAKPCPDFQMTGIGERSREVTSQMDYLSRPPPGAKFPLAKNGRIGEIGWPVEAFKIVKGI